MTSEFESPLGILKELSEIDISRLRMLELSRASGLPALSPREVDQLLSYDFSKLGASALEVTAVSGALFGVYVGLATMKDSLGDRFPDITSIPEFAHQALQHTYELYPVGDVQAIDPTVGDHLPGIALGAAISYTGFELLRGLLDRLRGGGLRESMLRMQEEVESHVKDGTMSWLLDPKDKSTVAFVGAGDPLSVEIADRDPGDIIQIANQPVEGPWVHLSDMAQHDDVLRALRAADYPNAGELLILPNRATEEFLPGPDDREMRVSRVAYYIRAADELCKKEGVPPKDVVVVTSRDHADVILNSHHSADDDCVASVTMEEKLQAVSEERGANIRLIDPTAIVMNAIVRIANGRPLALAGIEQHVSGYRERFFDSLRRTVHYEDGDKDAVNVWYGRQDITTSMSVQPDDIAVVLDPSQGRSMVEHGMPEERVIVVADEVLKETKHVFD